MPSPTLSGITVVSFISWHFCYFRQQTASTSASLPNITFEVLLSSSSFIALIFLFFFYLEAFLRLRRYHSLKTPLESIRTPAVVAGETTPALSSFNEMRTAHLKRPSTTERVKNWQTIKKQQQNLTQPSNNKTLFRRDLRGSVSPHLCRSEFAIVIFRRTWHESSAFLRKS